MVRVKVQVRILRSLLLLLGLGLGCIIRTVFSLYSCRLRLQRKRSPSLV